MLHVRYDGTHSGGLGSQKKEHFVGAGSFACDLAWKYATRRLDTERSGDHFRSLLEITIDEDARLDGFEEWDIPPTAKPERRKALPAKTSR
jgi:hypothetical protein